MKASLFSSHLTLSATSRPGMFLLLIVAFCSLATPAWSQSACDEALEIAQREYENGYFDEASFRLYACLGQQGFSKEQEKAAYLLLGKIHFANLDMEKARDSVRTLLERDPSMTLSPSEDYKAGFVELVQEVMAEMGKTEKKTPAPPRTGFWAQVSLGGAGTNIECDCPNLPDDDVWRGGGSGSFILALGGTLNPRLQLGAELSSVGRKQDEKTMTTSLLAVVAKYYPRATDFVFIKGGLGLGGTRLEAELPSATPKIETGGLGFTLGVGYDFVLGSSRKLALTPTLNLSAIGTEKKTALLDSGLYTGPKGVAFLQISLGLTWL